MYRNKSFRFFILAAICALSLPAFAADLPKARPEIVGLSTQRLGRIGEVMQRYVDEGRLGGAVTLVARGGKVAYLQAFGTLDPATGAAMTTDAIFRIASQTKAVTSVAVMILFEEGKILLGDPISKYIPEFKTTTVAVPDGSKKGPGYKIVPAKRPITIRDLLTHTAGISYGDGPAKDLYKAAGLQGWFLADRPEAVGVYIKKLASLPFDAQPGEKFVYGYNSDILGYLVEVVSGMSLADFVRTRITEPLSMADTAFFLPEEKAARLSAVYGIGKEGKAELVSDPKDAAYCQGTADLLRRRRRAPLDGRGLRPLPAHAPERRGVGRRPHPQPEDRRAHDRRSRRPALRQPGLRPRLLGDEGARPERRTRDRSGPSAGAAPTIRPIGSTPSRSSSPCS